MLFKTAYFVSLLYLGFVEESGPRPCVHHDLSIRAVFFMLIPACIKYILIYVMHVHAYATYVYTLDGSLQNCHKMT
jgi:hypothetical protein